MEINDNSQGQDPRQKVEKNGGYRIRKYRQLEKGAYLTCIWHDWIF